MKQFGFDKANTNYPKTDEFALMDGCFIFSVR